MKNFILLVKITLMLVFAIAFSAVISAFVVMSSEIDPFNQSLRQIAFIVVFLSLFLSSALFLYLWINRQGYVESFKKSRFYRVRVLKKYIKTEKNEDFLAYAKERVDRRAIGYKRSEHIGGLKKIEGDVLKLNDKQKKTLLENLSKIEIGYFEEGYPVHTVVNRIRELIVA